MSNGVLVDERCRTSAPDVYAAGDVANHLHPLFGRVRVEHYNNAEKHGSRGGAVDARLDRPVRLHPHASGPTSTSTSSSTRATPTKWDQFVVRGSLEERQLLGFYLLDGQLLAAVGLNRGGDPELDKDYEMAAAARLVGARARPAPDALADEAVDLWSWSQAWSRTDIVASRHSAAFENSGMFAPLAATSGLSSSATIRLATSSGVRPGRSSGLARRSISVSTAPGLMQIALMPSSLPSTAIASVRPTTPYLETL